MAPLYFDLSNVAVGDKVGAWTVVDVLAGEPKYPRGVNFAGAATVHGTFEYLRSDEPFFGGSVRFITDEAGAALLPGSSYFAVSGPDGKPRRVFLFTDEKSVRDSFGPEGRAGEATVLITDYHVTLIEGESSDSAKLVRVIKP